MSPSGTWRLSALALAAVVAWTGAAQAQSIELGTSGGNAGDKGYKRNGTLLFTCCSGTLGALVTSNGSDRHILSNNHVMALSNRAQIGDPIISPGLIDTNPVCDDSAGTTVATLSDFVPIATSGNTVDAAIAEVVLGTVDATGAIADIGQINGLYIGSPLGESVMKRGRTTGLTYGVVTEENVSVEVLYADECGSKKGFTAVFDNQFYVAGSEFSSGGDSGSLVLTDQPDGFGGVEAVGLLFAGDQSGTVMNPIGDVLDSFNVSLVTGTNTSIFTAPVDSGGGGGGGGNGGPPEGKGPPGSRGFGATGILTGLDTANAVKDEHAPDLLQLPGVVAVGVGVDESGQAVIVLHLETAIAAPGAPLPTEIEGVATRVRVTGPVVAY